MTALVCMTWDPRSTDRFGECAQSILNQIDADMFLYIVTAPIETRPESLIKGMGDAESFALENGISHFFHIDSRLSIPAGSLAYLLRLGRPVIVVPNADCHGAKTGEGDFKMLIDGGIRWDVLLVSLDVLRKYSLASAFKGDYLAPDRVWFKRLLMERVPIWIETGVRPVSSGLFLVDRQSQ